MKKRCTAIVLAAGKGKRMGTSVPKQFLELKGKPILYYSLAAFEASELIDEIILVCQEDLRSYCREEIVDRYQITKVKKIVAGGAERYHSVWHGLQAMEQPEGYVFIHDGARPFVTEEILQRVYDDVLQHRACVVGMPVKDTIKIADENGYVESTPNRSRVWQVQTPQVFEAGLIHDAYRRAILQEDELAARGIQITDDAMVVETISGQKVFLTEGSYENMKVTTPEDLDIAEIFV